MNPLIQIKNVSKIYRMGDESIHALQDVSLDIQKGEIVCLLGTSGSGKSTLLNILAGLEKPSRGEIWFGSIPIHKLSEQAVTKFRSLNIGFVFQSYNLIATQTALENVSLGLAFKGIAKKERTAMAKEILEAVGLGNRLYHRPPEMSGGQQQRVSIARAFAGNPSIIFADEPTGNLDTKTTFQVMDLMTSLAQQHNQTLIIVTHDEEITDYAHRILHMRDGKIESIEERKIQ